MNRHLNQQLDIKVPKMDSYYYQQQTCMPHGRKLSRLTVFPQSGDSVPNNISSLVPHVPNHQKRSKLLIFLQKLLIVI